MKNKQKHFVGYVVLSLILICLSGVAGAQVEQKDPKEIKKEQEKKEKAIKKAAEKSKKKAAKDSASVSNANSGKRVLYGLASYYSNKFHGRKTANGEIFSQDKLTAACNVLPLGTWIKVTNLRNGRTVVVKTNDRLHPKMKRIIDLTRTAATKLGYIKSGLTRVKVEVIGKKRPS